MGHQEMLNQIMEWWSPNFHDPWQRALLHMLLLLTLSQAVRPGSSARDLLLTAGLLHSMLYSYRHAPLLAIACAPIAAGRLGELLNLMEDWMSRRRWSYVRWRQTAAAALGIFMLAQLSGHARELPRGSWFAYSTEAWAFPAGACDFLLAQPGGGRLYNDYGWGGYCLWRLWPRYRVFIDGRAEVYFNAGYSEYHAIEALQPGWEERLRQWKVDTVLLPPNAALAQALTTKRDWRLVYQDELAVVFRTRPSTDEP
jgi:hypothetical protein